MLASEVRVLCARFITYAKTHLIAARVSGQLAVAVLDMIEEGRLGQGAFDEYDSLMDRAKASRLEAKRNLVRAERLNGVLFVHDEGRYPLKQWLSGKDFREWDAYQGAYDRSRLFKGVDPS